MITFTGLDKPSMLDVFVCLFVFTLRVFTGFIWTAF